MDFESFVLAAVTTDLGEEPAAREHADAIEYRLDLSEGGLDALVPYEGELPLLVTNRVESEGGDAPDAPARLDALETAVDQPRVEAVDVELAALEDGGGQRVLDRARETGVATVVSAHDFEGTPPRDRLRSLLDRACEHGDVGKLAVTASSPDDVLDLLAATRAATRDGGQVATMAMGAPGRHSRAVAPLYGSRIGYAPINPVKATAPGQYDLATLRDLVNRLRATPED